MIPEIFFRSLGSFILGLGLKFLFEVCTCFVFSVVYLFY